MFKNNRQFFKDLHIFLTIILISPKELLQKKKFDSDILNINDPFQL